LHSCNHHYQNPTLPNDAKPEKYSPLQPEKNCVEQLVISILDDLGVSRVLREAGFSSAEVKANVEKQAVISSSEQSSNTASSGASASPNPPKQANKKARLAIVNAFPLGMDTVLTSLTFVSSTRRLKLQ